MNDLEMDDRFTIICSCGEKFLTVTRFKKHQRETGHHGGKVPAYDEVNMTEISKDVEQKITKALEDIANIHDNYVEGKISCDDAMKSIKFRMFSLKSMGLFEERNQPYISDSAKRHFQDAMDSHLACFKQGGKTCNVGAGKLIDDVKNGCEVAFIGHDYTWHTHPCNIQPSPADVQTNQTLGRRYLCIGHSPTKTTTCYDLANGGKIVSKF